MKKTLICVLLVAMFAVMLCGCNHKGGDVSDTMTTVDRSSITTTLPSVETTTTTPPTEPTEPMDQPIAYTSELHPALQMTLPASWSGKYAVRESDTSIDFYELQNHLYDGSGKLFTLMFIPVDEYMDDMFPSYDVVYQSATTYVVALYPTDVQTSDEYFEQYNLMSAEIPNITETVQYTA